MEWAFAPQWSASLEYNYLGLNTWDVNSTVFAPAADRFGVNRNVQALLVPRCDFRISVGLREGWDAEGRAFDVSEAVRTARAWMKRGVESGQPALSGMFTRAEVTYAWPAFAQMRCGRPDDGNHRQQDRGSREGRLG